VRINDQTTTVFLADRETLAIRQLHHNTAFSGES